MAFARTRIVTLHRFGYSSYPCSSVLMGGASPETVGSSEEASHSATHATMLMCN